MPRYITLIGDIVSSRDLKARQDTQERLQHACRAINAGAQRSAIVSPFTITLGDEFQAVLDSAAGLWPCIFELESRLHPVAMRFAIGIGEIETAINLESAIGMDGPAFHGARDLVDSMKKEKIRYRLAGLGRDEQLVNHALALISHDRGKWRENRLHVFADLLAGKSIADIRDRLSISEQAVYQNIREGALASVRGVLEETAALIDETLAETPGRPGSES